VGDTQDDDGPNTDAIREAFEERAAIVEFEGGLSRADAERIAYALASAEITSLSQALKTPTDDQAEGEDVATF
jgi:hypothetical protein